MKFCLLTRSLPDVASWIERLVADPPGPDIVEIHERIRSVLQAMGRAECLHADLSADAVVGTLYPHEVWAKANDAQPGIFKNLRLAESKRKRWRQFSRDLCDEPLYAL